MHRLALVLRASLALARWVHRVTRPDLAAYLVPRWIALLLVIVELDVIVDWSALARSVAALPAASIGAVAAIGCALAAEDARRLIDATLRGPRLAVLRRQPLTGPRWGFAA